MEDIVIGDRVKVETNTGGGYIGEVVEIVDHNDGYPPSYRVKDSEGVVRYHGWTSIMGKRNGGVV